MPRRLLSAFIDLIAPPRKSERTVAALSLSDLERLANEDGLPYRDESIRALVWEIKYYANPRAAGLAGEYMAEELLAIASEELGAPLLIPVPMHAKRRKERGHNQTEVLCEAAYRALGGGTFATGPIEYKKDALRRVINTPHQQGLERTKRLKNVEGSMQASNVAGRVCIVVDDVATTGATLSEAKRALMAAGARRVHTVALARS